MIEGDGRRERERESSGDWQGIMKYVTKSDFISC